MMGRDFYLVRLLAASLAVAGLSPVIAQSSIRPEATAKGEATPPPPLETSAVGSGRVVGSTVGVAGQRQTRDQVKSIEPMARLSTRIANRVESRIRNRIGSNYDPGATSASPFTSAQEQTRISARRKR